MNANVGYRVFGVFGAVGNVRPDITNGHISPDGSGQA